MKYLKPVFSASRLNQGSYLLPTGQRWLARGLISREQDAHRCVHVEVLLPHLSTKLWVRLTHNTAALSSWKAYTSTLLLTGFFLNIFRYLGMPSALDETSLPAAASFDDFCRHHLSPAIKHSSRLYSKCIY